MDSDPYTQHDTLKGVAYGTVGPPLGSLPQDVGQFPHLVLEGVRGRGGGAFQGTLLQVVCRNPSLGLILT